MNVILRFVIAFFVISGVSTVLFQQFHIPFGSTNYWNVHGALFLVAIALFPRLTLLLSSVPLGGLLWWLSWLFAPRILVATMATLAYWNTNKLLVTIAWLIAFGGESTEKVWLTRTTKRRVTHRKVWVQDGIKHQVIDVTDVKR